MPKNHKLSIVRVYAELGAASIKFNLQLTNPNNSINKQWRWGYGLQTPRGGTYGYRFLRDGKENIIQVPEFISTKDEYIYIIGYITPEPIANVTMSLFTGLGCKVDLEMTPI